MSGTIQLISGGNTVTIRKPQFGYSSIAVMNFVYSQYPGGYSIFDYGSTYDYRLCKIPKWLLNATEQNTLADFFNSLSKARASSFTLRLGASATGFFAFGPDKGDVGDFTCTLSEHTASGVLYDPFFFFDNSITLRMDSAPAYSPAAAETEGTLSIGTVTTLRYPQQPAQPTRAQAITRKLAHNGAVRFIDAGSSADLIETELGLSMKRGNAAALVSYLTTTGRATDITIGAPANSYLFGRLQGSSGTYTTKLLTPSIEIKHERVDLFTTPLRFWRAA